MYVSGEVAVFVGAGSNSVINVIITWGKNSDGLISPKESVPSIMLLLSIM